MTTPRKYIDSHCLYFAVQGLIALLFGWFVAFTGINDSTTLVSCASIVMLGLGAIELTNLLHRTRLKETWGLSLAIAVMEIVVAVLLLFTLNQNPAWHLGIIATYTAVRGVLEILVGLHSVDDRTDKTLWVICGICGAVLGLVILNSGDSINTTAFLRAFGIYMIMFGLSSLFYGVHNHDQKQSYKEERRTIAKSSTKKITAKRATAKKSAKKSTRKSTKSRRK